MDEFSLNYHQIPTLSVPLFVWTIKNLTSQSSGPEGRIFLSAPKAMIDSFSCIPFDLQRLILM